MIEPTAVPDSSRHARPRRALLGALALLAACTSGWTAQPPPGMPLAPAPRPQAPIPAGSTAQRITPNFRNANIVQIIQAVSMVTGKDFIIDPRVQGQVTMLSATALTPAQFYQAFLAILAVHGFVAIPDGNVTKIVPDVNMRQYPSIDLPRHVSPISDEVVTEVIPVENVNAAQLVPVLRPLMPQSADLSSVTGGNMLIISDRANNVNRIIRIVRRIDQIGSSQINVVPLENATADDVARVLNSLLAHTTRAGTISVVADDRSNSILISGNPLEQLRLKALIANLDTPVSSGTETRVRYLQYADATDLAEHLREQLSGSGSSSSSPSSSSSSTQSFTQRMINRPNLPGQPQPNARGTTPARATNAPAAAPSGPATISLAGGTATIWADKDTNALVITATPKVMRAINAVIDKLDIRRAQVLVQAMIVEVDADNTADLGVNWVVDAAATGIGVGGFVTPIGGSSIVDLYDAIQGATGAASGTGTTTTTSLTDATLNGSTFGVGRFRASGANFAAILRALQSTARTDVLATPSVVTEDNQEAKMEVAQQVPFLTGQYTTISGAASAFNTVQEQDVGTVLTVTPTINAGNSILLKLEIESSSLSASTGVGGNPITNKRTITTDVLVRNGATLVLGGLIQNSVSNSQTAVPFLSRIPLLGELFRARNTDRNRTNLLIFLQPHILRTDQQAVLETNSKYQYLLDQEQRLNRDTAVLPLQPYKPPPALPPLENGRIPPFGSASTPQPAQVAPAATTPHE